MAVDDRERERESRQTEKRERVTESRQTEKRDKRLRRGVNLSHEKSK